MEKIKILYYEPSSGFGGSSGALVSMINHLERAKFCPLLAIKNFGPQFERAKDTETIKLKNTPEPEKLTNLSFLFYSFKTIIPEALKIYFIIKKKGISFVHTNTSIMAGVPAIIAAKLAGIHCICHFRGTRDLLKREKIFARWADRIIVLNKRAFDIFKEDVQEKKIRIIYDGVESGKFKNVESGLFRKALNLNSAPLVGLIGRIIKGKGQKEFILSAKEILRQLPEVKFVIVGDAKGDSDEYYNESRELVKKENLEKSVIFTGWRTDIENILANLDILVFSTTTFPEGLPNIIIEAMFLKKPVVVTNIPGPTEIVIDGVTGFLVNPGDINAMADKIIRLLKNRELASKMGEEGKNRAEKFFNLDEAVKKIEGLYLEVTSNIKLQ